MHATFDAEEVAPFTVHARGGDQEFVDDDGVRSGTTFESLGALRPAFSAEEIITAGNSSQITDNAAALVLVSRAIAAERSGMTTLAVVEPHAFVAGLDVRLHDQPSKRHTGRPQEHQRQRGEGFAARGRLRRRPGSGRAHDHVPGARRSPPWPSSCFRPWGTSPRSAMAVSLRRPDPGLTD